MGHPISAIGQGLKTLAILASVIATVFAAVTLVKKESKEKASEGGKYDGWDDALGM